MPLRCRDDQGCDLHSFALDDAEWSALAARNRTARHLAMHCCGARVALKTSRLGTRFFAHVARGGCATGDESAEHLALKLAAIEAAHRHGWTAEAEIAGDGWRADVLATRGDARVAVEVQWSRQPDDETRRRSVRYLTAGVFPLWLFRQRGFPTDRTFAAVRIEPAPGGLAAFGRPVAEALDAFFDRRLRHGFPLGARAEMRASAAPMRCWAEDCGAWNRPLLALRLACGDSRADFSLADLGEHPALRDELLTRLPPDPQRGVLKPRFSRARSRAYLSNGCFRCDRLFGEVMLAPHTGEPIEVTRVTLAVTQAWRAAIDAADANGAADLRWSVVSPAAR